MKVSKIIADIEYQTPSGIKNCSDGWDLEEAAFKLAANPDPNRRIVDSGYSFPGTGESDARTHTEIPETGWQDLKKELGKGIAPKPLKGKIELVG